MRFNTDRALFDAFPTALDHIKTPPADLPPRAFLDRLITEGKFSEALSFCAYLLKRRDAVAWGCESLAHQRRRDGRPLDQGCLRTARNWVHEPSEKARGAAYQTWKSCDKNDPAAWLALGAAWSGGSLSSDVTEPVPAAPHLTAVMVRGAFLLTLHEISADKKAAVTQDWISEGLQHAEAAS